LHRRGRAPSCVAFSRPFSRTLIMEGVYERLVRRAACVDGHLGGGKRPTIIGIILGPSASDGSEGVRGAPNPWGSPGSRDPPPATPLLSPMRRQQGNLGPPRADTEKGHMLPDDKLVASCRHHNKRKFNHAKTAHRGIQI
jgi:hypothetical protein